MKRKKWSEVEEQTLLSKYSELFNSGALLKLKTREKKYKPIADHVNAVHHLQDPVMFPFKWSWRDVTIKVQNMRHQYLGVKQKIRTANNEFNWKDGENHWENFLKYKEVFGDVELELKDYSFNCGKKFGDDPFAEGGMLGLGLGFGIDSEESEEGEDEDELGDDVGISEEAELGNGERSGREMVGDSGCAEGKKLKKGISQKRLRMVGARILNLRDVVLRREEKRRERDWNREDEMMEREHRRRETELQRKRCDEDKENSREMRELELEERQMMWTKKELEKRLRLERELAEERQRRMELEEKWEEEEMEWRERLVSMQLEHEKQMMQMHADACQNQMQILGVMTRLMCQFFGVANDGLGSGLGTLPHQVLQNLQHPGGLEDNGKPGAASPSEFCRLWKYFNMDVEVEMRVVLDFPTAQGMDSDHFREHIKYRVGKGKRCKPYKVYEVVYKH